MRASPLFSWWADTRDPSYQMHAPVVKKLQELGYQEAEEMDKARFVFPAWDQGRALLARPDRVASFTPYTYVATLQAELLLLDVQIYNDMLRRAGNPLAVTVHCRHAPGSMTGSFLQRPAFGGVEGPTTAVVTNPTDWYHPSLVLVPLPASPLRFRDTIVVLRGAVLVLGSGRCFLSSAAEALMFHPSRFSTPRLVSSVEDLGLSARDVFYTPVQTALRAYFAEAGPEVLAGRQFRILQVSMMPGQRDGTIVPNWVEFHVLRMAPAASPIQQQQLEELIACLINPDVGRFTLEVPLS